LEFLCATPSYDCFSMTDKPPSSPRDETDGGLSAERPPDNDAGYREAGPSRYFAKRPTPRRLSWETLKQSGRTVWHLFRHTLASYDPNPPELTALTSDNPKGSIQREQIELCRLVYDTEEHRHEKVEEKATATLSLVAALTPFIVSAVVYMATSSAFSARERGFALVIFALSFLSLLIAFIASVRATGIRAVKSLHIHSVIDPETDVIKAFNPDSFGRGLLWCASVNSAVNDHIADFVRAAQMFLVFSVILLVFAAAPVLVMLKPTSQPQEITGNVKVQSAALQEISGSMTKTSDALTQLEKDRAQIERMEGDVSALRNRIADLEKRGAARETRGHLPSSKESTKRKTQ
jgi:hypothetical protein